jgi:hypothetical protein
MAQLIAEREDSGLNGLIRREGQKRVSEIVLSFL